MEIYLIEHGTHVPRPVIQLFLDLCQACHEPRGRNSTPIIIHKPIIPDTVRHASSLTWLIRRLYQMTDRNITSTTRTA